MRLSVVTPSFRQLDFIKLCAASVADQRGSFDHEHLVQDGGSGAELEAWAASQDFADVRIENDDGMYDAINRGFGRASGEILCWLNCDEQYLPGTLEKVARWFEANPDKDVLVGDVVLISGEGVPIAYRQAVTPWLRHTRHCFLSSYSAATFVRRRVIDEGHLLSTEYRMISDALWICDLIESGYRFGVLNEPLAVFTQTGDNMGQLPEGFDEGKRWRKSEHSDGRLGKLFWDLAHRLRKLKHGAYRSREVEVMIHRDDSGERRKVSAQVGGRWKKF